MKKLALAVALFASLMASPARAQPVEVALLLAVDTSGSVDDERYNLQREGIARVLESNEFANVLRSQGSIAIAVLHWASTNNRLALPWTFVDLGNRLAVARAIRATKQITYGDTCVTKMFQSASAAFALAPASNRQILDVSGDGAENCFTEIKEGRRTFWGDSVADPAEALLALVNSGVIVNGLPIDEAAQYDAETDVIGWYEKHVQGGENSFVEPAEGYGDFSRAMLRKMVREIS